MFSRQGGLSNAGGNSSHLVEFRAGRMNLIGKMVHPDTRKGLVYMTQSEDGLMHFCWKNRSTGKVEDDLIVFPDDFEYKRVEQCTTGRVYVLKFKTNTRRMFFWMQEPKTDKDDEYCRRVNELLNNPPSTTRGGQEGGDIQYMLNNMSQQQLMQLFGGVGQMGGLSSLLGSMNARAPSSRNASSGGGTSTTGGSATTTETTAALSSRTTPVAKATTTKTEDTTAAGSATGAATTGTASADAPGGGSDASGTAAKRSEGGEKSGGAATSSNVDRTLSTEMSASLVGSEVVSEIAGNPDQASTLAIHLPVIEGMDSDKKKQVLDTIASPQFQQALTQFLNAVQSTNLGPCISQFELPNEAVSAAFAGNLEDFVKALDKAKLSVQAKPSAESETDGKNDDRAESPKKDDKKDPAASEKPPAAE